MSSKAANPIMRSAAWRISLWTTLAFAIGTMLVFAMLHRFVANDIQRRSDAWLSGEVEVFVLISAGALSIWHFPAREFRYLPDNAAVEAILGGSCGDVSLQNRPRV